MPTDVLVRVPDTDAEYGGRFRPARTIRNVRIERHLKVRRTQYQFADTTTGLMFVDRVTSAGAFDIPPGSMVSADGGATWSSVNACHRFEGFGGRVHHWEVELA